MRMFFLAMVLSLFSTFSLFGQNIDQAQSYVSFEISNMLVNTVEGTLKGMKGTIEFDPAQLSTSKFEVCIDPATVDTENEKRDADLRSENYFHVEKYPSICFVSTGITQRQEGYLAKGKLTMHGITQSVEIPFTLDGNTFKGSLAIDRFDYNIGEETGKFMMGSEAELEIVCRVAP